MKPKTTSFSVSVMNTRFNVTAVAAFASLAIWQSPAFAQDFRRFYIGFDAGAALLQDATVKDSSNSAINSGQRIRFEPGARLDFAFGYRITAALATELEMGVVFAEIKSFSDIPVPGGGSDLFFQVPIMATIVYRFQNNSKIQPFLGVGAGGVDNVLEQRLELGSFGYSTTARESDFTFGYQGFAGIRYNLSDRADLALVYKLMGTTEQNYGHDFGFRTDGVLTHQLGLAFTWRF